ncbi:MAG: LamG-like jellyroll fold domain-containing protein [Candidatus Paceibacterota bacterium]
MADHRLNKFLSHNSQSFTLIEILITVAIIAVLMTVVVLAINPTEITKKARDTQRLTDMANLEMLLQLARSEGMLNTSYCDGTKIYASLPSETPLSNNNLPAGISWVQVSEDKIRNTDGTGWIPLNFKSLNYLQTSVLPVDPKNSLDNSLYYTFYCNPQRGYILTAYPESQTFGPKGGKDSKTIGDGGPDPYVYEVGNNLFISPLKPVGSWSFDEGAGTIVNDSSGNNNSGTLISGPTWTDGQVNKALSFDGTDDYVDMGNISNFPTSATSPFTLELWWYREEPLPDNAEMHMLAIGSPSEGKTRALGVTFRDGRTRLDYLGYNYNFILDISTHVGWHHAVATMDNKHVKVYYDGGLVGETILTVNDLVSTQMYIGKGFWANPFKGLIDEVRIYNRALSAGEIKRHYEMSK